jgi:cellulose synthase/poly-beta-1,6-N-acetylglucosamine synthase-like glycosyltransferase
MLIENICLVLSLLILLNTVINSLFLLHLRNTSTSTDSSVVVLLPLRNEEINVVEIIENLKVQEGLRKIAFHLIDDNSIDDTFSLAKNEITSDARFSLIHGEFLAPGWMGKPFALQQGLLQSRSDVVVIVDADVRLKPHALSRAISLLYERNLDFMSAYPRQIAVTWSERLIQPLLQWSWLATVPLRMAERSPNPAFAVANGQFFLARRGALEKIGGFQAVKNDVLDDIFLARTLLRSGYRGTVVDASEVASCRMYKSWKEIQSGYGKSLRRAFGGVVGSFIASGFLLATGLLPLILLLRGSLAGLIAFIAICLSRIVSAKATDGKVSDSLLHPISSSALIYLIFYSWLARKNITWKGRRL